LAKKMFSLKSMTKLEDLTVFFEKYVHVIKNAFSAFHAFHPIKFP